VAATSGHDTITGTIVFTDLVGFTAFNGVVGDEAAIAVLDRQTHIAHEVLDCIAAGRVVKELGDGLMLWFESPERALAFSTSLLERIEAGRDDGSFPLAVRIGMHHGEAMARGDDLAGQTINIGSRIADVAGPGEILLSDAVVEAGCGRTDLEPIGGAQVKGVDEPIWLYRIATPHRSGHQIRP
jgi:adenylate cyclase